jgi:hypothetical protein
MLKFEGQILQNEQPYGRRVEGKDTKRNYVRCSGRTSSGKFEPA